MENRIDSRLKGLRTLKNVSQKDVADLLKVKRQTYSAYERGVSVPDAITLSVLADYFECSVDYILGKTDNMAPRSLIIPDVLEGKYVAFDRGEFEDLTQDEVDALASIAETLKKQRRLT